MTRYNIVAKSPKGKEYMLGDMMATTLSRAKFERIKELNPQLFDGYHWIPFSKTQPHWWEQRVLKKLTATKIIQTSFSYNNGNIKELGY